MINEIQPKIKFQNIVQCPFNIFVEEIQITEYICVYDDICKKYSNLNRWQCFYLEMMRRKLRRKRKGAQSVSNA